MQAVNARMVILSVFRLWVEILNCIMVFWSDMRTNLTRAVLTVDLCDGGKTNIGS